MKRLNPNSITSANAPSMKNIPTPAPPSYARPTISSSLKQSKKYDYGNNGRWNSSIKIGPSNPLPKASIARVKSKIREEATKKVLIEETEVKDLTEEKLFKNASAKAVKQFPFPKAKTLEPHLTLAERVERTRIINERILAEPERIRNEIDEEFDKLKEEEEQLKAEAESFKKRTMRIIIVKAIDEISGYEEELKVKADKLAERRKELIDKTVGHILEEAEKQKRKERAQKLEDKEMIFKILISTQDKAETREDTRRQSEPKVSIVEETKTLIENGIFPQNSNPNSISKSELISPQVNFNMNEDKLTENKEITANLITKLLAEELTYREKAIQAEYDKKILIERAVVRAMDKRELAKAKASEEEKIERDRSWKFIANELIEKGEITSDPGDILGSGLDIELILEWIRSIK